MEEDRFQSHVDHLGWSEGPHSPSSFREEDRIRDVEGFGKSVPKQERKPKYGATREDAQYQDGQGRSGVGSMTDDEELVQIALNGFSKPWDTFVKGVVAREKLPDW